MHSALHVVPLRLPARNCRSPSKQKGGAAQAQPRPNSSRRRPGRAGRRRLLAQILQRRLSLRNPHRIFFQFHKAPVVGNGRRLVAGRLKNQAAIKVRARKRRVNLQRAVKVRARFVKLFQRDVGDAAVVVCARKFCVLCQAGAKVRDRLGVVLQRQIGQPALH